MYAIVFKLKFRVEDAFGAVSLDVGVTLELLDGGVKGVHRGTSGLGYAATAGALVMAAARCTVISFSG